MPVGTMANYLRILNNIVTIDKNGLRIHAPMDRQYIKAYEMLNSSDPRRNILFTRWFNNADEDTRKEFLAKAGAKDRNLAMKLSTVTRAYAGLANEADNIYERMIKVMGDTEISNDVRKAKMQELIQKREDFMRDIESLKGE
jgi:hypothetical protein